MSYRELRRFTEIMRSLGYPHKISVDSFRTPNFELVADCLYWLTTRYDPHINISDEYSTEEDRINLLTTIAEKMASLARIRLNTKKLYAAEGHAVRELLKIANILYNAHINTTDDDTIEDVDVDDEKRISVDTAKDLSNGIRESGVKLYDLLGEESQLSASRAKTISFLDTSGIGGDLAAKKLNGLITSAEANEKQLDAQIDELKRDKSTFEKKLEKKNEDYERLEKKIHETRNFRPAYMDEYERLEDEMRQIYAEYLSRYRNLDYLEKQLDKYNKQEEESAKEAQKELRKLQMKMKRDMDQTRKNNLDDVDEDDSESGSDSSESESGSDEDESDGDVAGPGYGNRAAASGNVRGGGGGERGRPVAQNGGRYNMRGNMAGGAGHGDDSSSGSDSASDSDEDDSDVPSSDEDN